MLSPQGKKIWRDSQADKQRGPIQPEIYSHLGLPTVDNFMHMVSANMISNCTISVEYMINSEKIYGPFMSGLKNKSTRSKPRPEIKDVIKISIKICKNNSNIQLCIDVVYITGKEFRLSIGKEVKYRSIIRITFQNEEEFFKGLDKIL